jgi:hypothetical protein
MYLEGSSNVKIQKLTCNLIIALVVLASPIVGAEDYPAANFQPTVIYNDTDDKQSTSSSTSNTQAKTSEPDTNYPAANFQPTIVYSDTDYKHQSSTIATKTTAISSANNSEDLVNEEWVEESEDSFVILFGLFVLVAVGFMFLKRSSLSMLKSTKKSKLNNQSKASNQIANTNGVTGVARYVSKNMPELSTVAKYLRDKNKIPTSGVSKYVAKKIIATKVAAISKKTGVEKYLRNRG